MLLVEPKAVAHSPTFREPAVAAAVLVYLVEAVTLTVKVFIWSAGREVPVVVDEVVPEKAKLIPCTVMVEPETEVTWPEAVSKLLGRVTVVWAPEVVVRVRKPPPGPPPPPKPPPPPPAKPPRPAAAPVHLPFTAASIEIVVASMAPAAPLVPLAVTHLPALTSAKAAAKVAVIRVLAVRSTVVWLSVAVSWTSRMSPVMLAMAPVAAGAKALVPGAPPPEVVGGVVLGLPVATAVVEVVLEELAAAGDPPPPHPAAIREMRATAAAGNATRPTRPRDISNVLNAVFLLRA
jgi:hypothetical protein